VQEWAFGFFKRNHSKGVATSLSGAIAPTWGRAFMNCLVALALKRSVCLSLMRISLLTNPFFQAIDVLYEALVDPARRERVLIGTLASYLVALVALCGHRKKQSGYSCRHGRVNCLVVRFGLGIPQTSASRGYCRKSMVSPFPCLLSAKADISLGDANVCLIGRRPMATTTCHQDSREQVG